MSWNRHDCWNLFGNIFHRLILLANIQILQTAYIFWLPLFSLFFAKCGRGEIVQTIRSCNLHHIFLCKHLVLIGRLYKGKGTLDLLFTFGGQQWLESWNTIWFPFKYWIFDHFVTYHVQVWQMWVHLFLNFSAEEPPHQLPLRQLW